MTTDTQSQNPVISQAGTATITATQTCTWETANGASSTITISNASVANILNFTVNGAPETGITVQVNGEAVNSPNGIFTLQENDPNDTYVAFGDFQGQNVTITNTTSTGNDATANLVAEIAE